MAVISVLLMLPFPWLLRRLGIEAPETSWAVPAGCLLLVLLAARTAHGAYPGPGGAVGKPSRQQRR